MAKKTVRKQKSSVPKNGAAIQLTRKKLFLWLGIAFLGMVWMFTLGVMVGRGLSPVRFDVQKLKKELMALKEEALKRGQARLKSQIDNPSGNSEFEFYKILTAKKEGAQEMKWQGGVTIQVASFQNAKHARQMVARLKSKGYEAYEVSAIVPNKGTCHRVRVGHFRNSSEAGRVAERLKREKLETMIVRE
ncbi:MAG: SPOR domain-containing protein [Desulfobacterales bacterium]|nr:SPOR domain-containing protein [Desulfobacterales bacterium]